MGQFRKHKSARIRPSEYISISLEITPLLYKVVNISPFELFNPRFLSNPFYFSFLLQPFPSQLRNPHLHPLYPLSCPISPTAKMASERVKIGDYNKLTIGALVKVLGELGLPKRKQKELKGDIVMRILEEETRRYEASRESYTGRD